MNDAYFKNLYMPKLTSNYGDLGPESQEQVGNYKNMIGGSVHKMNYSPHKMDAPESEQLSNKQDIQLHINNNEQTYKFEDESEDRQSLVVIE